MDDRVEPFEISAVDVADVLGDRRYGCHRSAVAEYAVPVQIAVESHDRVARFEQAHCPADGPPEVLLRWSHAGHPPALLVDPHGTVTRLADANGSFTDTFNLPDWVLDISPLRHVPNVTAASPDWAGLGWLAAFAALFLIVGFVGFRRRDVI